MILVWLGACGDATRGRDAASATDDAGFDAGDDAGTGAGGGGTGTGGTGGDTRDAGRVTQREPFPDAGATPYDAEIGISDPGTGDWAPLSPGGDIPIGGAGQVGLTARLAVRLTGIADPGASFIAVVRVVLTNPANGVTADSRPWDIRVPFDCRDGVACYRVPVLVEISHVAKLPELEGLEVTLAARILDENDLERVLAQASNRGVLRRF